MTAIEHSKKLLLSFSLIFISHQTVFGQAYRQTLDIRAPESINFISIAGKPTAYYELHLTNFSADTIKLKQLTILSNDSSILLTIQKEDLRKRYSRISKINKDTSTWLASGSSAVVYVELNTQAKEITHHILFQVIGKTQLVELVKPTATIKCNYTKPLVLGAPLKGGDWTSIYEPTWTTGHRRFIYTWSGKARIPGRYAIDFIKVDNNGKTADDDENLVENWFGYSGDVLAVADGVVSSTKGDYPESITLSDHPKYSADKATGNYISLKISDNQYAFYEHLKSRSIRVKPGQKVKKGEVIASLGFTGQSSGPHLHFHVADNDSPLGAEGVPFVFEYFETLGFYPDFIKFGKITWTPISDSSGGTRKEERPLPNSVLKFR